jgi:UDP-N-acetylglucosamine acyltransferase
MSEKIHPAALIDSTAKIGKGTEIGAYCTIGPNVEIGENCKILDHASIVSHTRLGDGCRIYHYAAVGGNAQDLKYDNEETWLEVGNNVVVREYVTLNRGTVARGKTKIGNNAVFLAYSHVGHDTIVGANVILSNSVQIGGHVDIGDYVIIGGGTVVHQFTKIGAHAMIGGGFRVIMDVMPYSMAGNEPLSIHGINKIGLERRGFSAEAIKEIKKAYKIFFRMNLTKDEAIEKIKSECPDLPEIAGMLDFIDKSERGLVR